MPIPTSKQTLTEFSPILPSGRLARPVQWRSLLQTLVVLFKLRIVALLVLAAIGGAFLGARGWPGLGTLLLVIVTGTMAAAGASAMNQYIERQRDSLMSRTRARPLPSGDITQPTIVVPIAVALILVPVLAVVFFNPALAFFLLAGAFIYVGIYTLWLKPRTLLNIVIGGAAGSAAVMSGGAAAGAWQDPAVIILALLVFLWTPSHFWSLAILYRQDYLTAGVPMLPAQTGLKNAAWWVLLHSGGTALAAMALALTPALGWVYFIPALLISLDLLRRNVALILRPDPVRARSFFLSSNSYLMVILLAVCVGVFF